MEKRRIVIHEDSPTRIPIPLKRESPPRMLFTGEGEGFAVYHRPNPSPAKLMPVPWIRKVKSARHSRPIRLAGWGRTAIPNWLWTSSVNLIPVPSSNGIALPMTRHDEKVSSVNPIPCKGVLVIAAPAHPTNDRIVNSNIFLYSSKLFCDVHLIIPNLFWLSGVGDLDVDNIVDAKHIRITIADSTLNLCASLNCMVSYAKNDSILENSCHRRRFIGILDQLTLFSSSQHHNYDLRLFTILSRHLLFPFPGCLTISCLRNTMIEMSQC